MIHGFWTGLCLDWLISAKPLFTDQERLSNSFLSDKESNDVPRNVTGFPVITGMKCMLLLTLSDYAFHSKSFLQQTPGFLIWKVLQTFLPNLNLWLHGSAERKSDNRSTINVFAGDDKSNWKIEMSISAYINSKITFSPAKNSVIDTVLPINIPAKCCCQLDGIKNEKDLLQRLSQ